MSEEILYPDIHVDLTSIDGNAFSIMGHIKREMQRNNVPSDQIKKFLDECMSGDYDHLVQTCMKWVNTDG